MQDNQEPQAAPDAGPPPGSDDVAGANLTDRQKAMLVQLGQMMGPHMDEFDQRVQALHDKRHQAEHDATDYEKEFSHERLYGKMKQAQTGGAGPGLGPTEAEAALQKQQATLAQQTAAQQQQMATQAQGQQTSPTPPTAPSGPQGVTQPYPAQAAPEEEEK